jgi:tetratricopeptide (TPR) repeat protein
MREATRKSATRKSPPHSFINSCSRIGFPIVRRATLNLFLLAILLFFLQPPIRAQRPAAASEDFEQVVEKAEQALAASRSEEAIALYRKALGLRPQWAEGWWRIGTTLYELEDFAGAARAIGKATTLNPKVGTAWVMLGLCEFKLNRFNEALEHIQKGRSLGVSNDPQFRTVMLYHEGVLLVGKGEFEKAQDALGSLCRDGVNNTDVIDALGLAVLRLRLSDLQAGDAALRDLVRRAGYAESLAAQKKFDEAQVEYERLTTEFPKAQNIHYAYGRFLLAVNQEEKAQAAFQGEIDNLPTHLLARLMIAQTKFNLKDFAGGLPYAEAAVNLSPRLPLGHYLLGFGLLETGQTARAINELETARTAIPNEPKIYFALSRAYARANRKADAAQARATFMRLSEPAEKPASSDNNAQPETTRKKRP